MSKQLVATLITLSSLMVSSAAHADDLAAPVMVTPPSSAASATPRSTAPTTTPPPSTSTPVVASKPSTGPFIAMGVGVGGMLAGAFLLGLAGSQESLAETSDDIDRISTSVGTAPSDGLGDRQRDSAKDLRVIGYGVLGVGCGLVVGGAIWYAIDRYSTPTKKAGLRLLPTVAPTVAGAALSGTF